MKKIFLCAMLLPSLAISAPLGDFSFKSPAFNGSGYSSHVLTIENQEATRRKARDDAAQAALDKIASDKKNTNIAKFMNNLESRIYAQFSQNLATAMFANGNCATSSDPCQGKFVMEYKKTPEGIDYIDPITNLKVALTAVEWRKVGTDVEMTVVQGGDRTTVIIPLSQFQIPGL